MVKIGQFLIIITHPPIPKAWKQHITHPTSNTTRLTTLVEMIVFLFILENEPNQLKGKMCLIHLKIGSKWSLSDEIKKNPDGKHPLSA